MICLNHSNIFAKKHYPSSHLIDTRFGLQERDMFPTYLIQLSSNVLKSDQSKPSLKLATTSGMYEQTNPINAPVIMALIAKCPLPSEYIISVRYSKGD